MWDSRAVVKVEVMQFNRSGARVDSTVTELTNDQRNKRSVELTLNRSCVNYKLRLIVDGSKSPIGKGMKDVYVKLRRGYDYWELARNVNNGATTLNAIQLADIGVRFNGTSEDDLLGTKQMYSGVYNGNGYAIELTATANTSPIAPIMQAGNGAVISGLHVTGDFRVGKERSGCFIGQVKKGAAFIENCGSSARLTYIQDATNNGGFVGLAGDSTYLHISNSLFAGTLTNDSNPNSATFTGGFVGMRTGGNHTMMSNCYFNPEDYLGWTMACSTFCGGTADAFTRVVLQDCLYKVDMYGITQGKKSDTAPQNACWQNGAPTVEKKEFSTPVSGSSTEVTIPADKFYYENIGYVLKESLKAEPLQNSVLLTWNATENAAVDNFIVYRRKVSDAPGSWSAIAQQVTENRYEDKDASPVFDYYYKVASSTDCEGKHVMMTDSVLGHCIQTGSVSGYVRFTDGTGIPNVTVDIIPEGSGGGSSFKTVTDECGFFEQKGIPFWKATDGKVDTYTYKIAPNVQGQKDLSQPLSFKTDASGNTVSGVVFTITESVKVSGHVLYNGTSIPVQGVSFLVDGYEVNGANGKVTTDFDGKYSIRMLKGTHTIQAFKDGHLFYQNGYYHEKETDPESKTSYDWQTDKADIYFYDNTRVKLIGRVAGGKVQGATLLTTRCRRTTWGPS